MNYICHALDIYGGCTLCLAWFEVLKIYQGKQIKATLRPKINIINK